MTDDTRCPGCGGHDIEHQRGDGEPDLMICRDVDCQRVWETIRRSDHMILNDPVNGRLNAYPLT